MERKWFIVYNGQQVGTLTKYELINYGLSPDSSVWCQGMPDWRPAGVIPELADAIGMSPAGSMPPPPPAKSKIVAGILAIFLGFLGVQYFYIGKTVGGIISIVLTLVTCGLWEIIPFIQGILMLVMSDDEFNRKYLYAQSQFPLF